MGCFSACLPDLGTVCTNLALFAHLPVSLMAMLAVLVALSLLALLLMSCSVQLPFLLWFLKMLCVILPVYSIS